MTDDDRISKLEKRVKELETKVRLLRGEYKRIYVMFDSEKDLDKAFKILYKERIDFGILGFKSISFPEVGEKYLLQNNLKYKKYRKEELMNIIDERANDPEFIKQQRKEVFGKYGKRDPREK